jgi:opacity protein-like surface antigen
MKSLYLFFTWIALFLLISIDAISQQKPYFSISYGRSIPKGEFIELSLSSLQEGTGYANNGANLGIEFTYPIAGVLNTFLLYRNQSNSFNSSELEKDYESQGTGSFSIIAEDYKLNFILTGFSLHAPLSEKVFFIPKLLIGISDVRVPNIATAISSNNGIFGQTTSVFVREIENSTAFTYGLGAGLKFDIHDHICLILDGNYIFSKHQWEVENVSTGDFRTSQDIESKINNIQLNAGVGYIF